MQEQDYLNGIDEWLDRIINSNADDYVIYMDTFKDLFTFNDDLETYLKENEISKKNKRIFKKFVKQVKQLKELPVFYDLVYKNSGTLKEYLKNVNDVEKSQFEKIVIKLVHCNDSIFERFSEFWYDFKDLFRLDKGNDSELIEEPISEKSEQKEEASEEKKKFFTKKEADPNELADYYTYQFYKETEKYLKKDESERTGKDLKKYSKKVSKLDEKYDQILNGRKPNEVFDHLNNSAAGTVKKNKENLDSLLQYDKNGYLDAESYLKFLEMEQKEDILTEQECQDAKNTYQTVNERCTTFVKAFNFINKERKEQIIKNYKKHLNKLRVRIGLFALAGVLTITGLGSCANDKGKNKPIYNDTTIESTYENYMEETKESVEQEENIVVDETLKQEQDENVEIDEIVNVEQEETKTEEKEETKDFLEEQKSILESLRKKLNVSDLEEEKYISTISIGDTVNLTSDSEQIYSDVYSMAKEVNGKNSFYGMSEDRLVQSLVMAKDGQVVNVHDMEKYEQLTEEGYSLVGVSVINEHSVNGEIEGRYAVDSLVLKK